MRYLVTGGAGFIGANFVKYVLRKHSDARIIVLDALTYAGNLASISEEIQQGRVTFVRGNICDSECVSRILEEHDPDFVVNFAAETHVDRSIHNPRVFLETNVIGTQCLLECCRQAWLDGSDDSGRPHYRPGKRYLQISTDEVYGSLPKDFAEAQRPPLTDEVEKVIEGRGELKCFGDGFFTEVTPLSPRSPYSAAKTSADLMVDAYWHTYGLPVNITRCSNNYGPYQFPEKLIPLVINNVLHGKKLPVYGDGRNVRDWLYVDDHCKAIDMVLAQGRVGEVYNIGGFNEEENITIVSTIIDVIGRLIDSEPQRYGSVLHCDRSAVSRDLITYVTDRPGHDRRYAIDPSKIASELGWYPETPFTEGIEKTVRWYLDNCEWTDDVTSEAYKEYYKKMYPQVSEQS
ncbi:MAG: dTDP-glucose 4,6-dehydratase [Barnesiella sp.]|nr:dTDP-glucose 4,6-dehydratase [Barnesiella sp.]